MSQDVKYCLFIPTPTQRCFIPLTTNNNISMHIYVSTGFYITVNSNDNVKSLETNLHKASPLFNIKSIQRISNSRIIFTNYICGTNQTIYKNAQEFPDADTLSIEGGG